jgi:hypothetical protein
MTRCHRKKLREHVQKEESAANARDEWTRYGNAHPGTAAAPAWIAARCLVDDFGEGSMWRIHRCSSGVAGKAQYSP